jgi:hypothetical protein
VSGTITLYPEHIARLRRRLSQHNLQVIVITLLTCAAAVLLWGAAWFLLYWVALFSLSVWRGGDAEAPAHFTGEFAAIALFLLVLAWIDRRFTTDERAVDRKPALEIFLDFVLMPARVTLSIWGSMTAWQKLSDDEIAEAASLLARIQAERKLAEHSVPLEVPDDATRERLVFALLLLGIVEQRREDGITWLVALEDAGPKKAAIR